MEKLPTTNKKAGGKKGGRRQEGRKEVAR